MSPLPEKIYRIMDTKADAQQAILAVLKKAQTTLCIFDQSAESLREREFGRPQTIEVMRQLLLGNRSRQIRIALHETRSLTTEVPRLMVLLDEFSTQISIQRTTDVARSVQDVMLIADDDCVWRKPVASHPRSIVTMHEAADVKPFLDRFNEIWLLTEDKVTSRGTGL